MERRSNTNNEDVTGRKRSDTDNKGRGDKQESNMLSLLTSTIQVTCSSVEAGQNGEKKEDESRKHRRRRRLRVSSASG